ncbi:serine/threonine-protein kinase [Pyxidicoccus xibeiensis]|uniref:serine/threonine-protein kinase n=1 Tax=Pyxidicoccus xibeiensis TaxID=2906759 RepID=UPI0020A751B5|nr:serine/threonine-protein kinase [Pyxidicoccus xibeiensis]MCP3144235.1 serine/threonine protein kinase [Pyxidicoccus xibeiensis]
MPKPAINRDTVSGEALFILRNLRENGRLGRSNKLADVKATLEPSVSLEFDNYFFFLRKFHYIAMDREAQLKLTEHGERVAGGELQDRFTSEVGEFFADQLGPSEDEPPVAQGTDEPLVMPPPPPELLLDEAEVVIPPLPPAPPPAMPPARGSRTGLPALEVTASQASPLSLAPATPAAPEARREATLIAPSPFAPSAPTPVAASLPSITPPLAAAPMPPPAAPTPAAAAPAAASAPKGAELDLRYQKFDPIGTGPLGTVFKGRFTALGLDICLKELKDIFGYFSFLQRGEVLRRLKKELCAQAQVRHPGVVQVVDQNVDTARPYFVLELMHGSLKERLDAGGGNGIPVPVALRAFLQMAYGLRAAHASGLTHHNLKPENVLFDAYGNAKLSDFGLGRVVEVDATKGMPQVFMGTGGMSYMAPELLGRGGKEPGASADVYGLGILLYEMLTGQIPGRRSALPSEVNPEAPSGLDQLFDKATQDKREQRYPDMDAMLEDFYKAFPDKEYLVRGDVILSSDTPKG